MTTAREMLDRYNELAARHGAPHYNVWKAAKDSLRIKLEALEAKDYEARLAAAKEVVNADSVTLACIARSIGLEPKDARAKARRHHELFGSYEVARHVYPYKDRDAIIELLTRDHRKA